MSGKRYVKKIELDNLKRSYENEATEIKESVRSYCSRASEIETVISNLISFYNTIGGINEVKKLRSIDLKEDSFKSVASWASNIKIDYNKSKMKKV